jgi:hypothetical protein
MTLLQDIHSLFSSVFLQKCPESGSSTLRAILSIKASNKFKDHLTKVGIEFEFEDDENFGSVQGEIVSIADETKDDVLDELQYPLSIYIQCLGEIFQNIT